MTQNPRHNHERLRQLIRKRLGQGKEIFIGCALTNIEYWFNVLSLHFPNRKIEKCENGVRVS